MITSNIQLGFLLTRGGGQAVQGGLSCPPPRISERMDNPAIFITSSTFRNIKLKEIYTLFQSIWDANIKCSVGLRIDKGWGASCPGRFILPPAQNFSENG